MNLDILYVLSLLLVLLDWSPLVSPATRHTACNNLLADVVFVMDASQRTITTYRRVCGRKKRGFWRRRRRRNPPPPPPCRTEPVHTPNSDFYNAARNFVVSVLSRTQSQIKPRSLHMGVVGMVGGSVRRVNLQDKHFYGDILASVRGFTSAPTTGQVNPTSMLAASRSMLTSSTSRAGAPKLVILVSDGRSPGVDNAAPAEANRLKAAGIRVMTVMVNGGNTGRLRGLASSSDYVHSSINGGTPNAIYSQLDSLACAPVCSWHKDYCFPGTCGEQGLARDCQCATGFSRSQGPDALCQLDTRPDLSTCRLTMKDSVGNEVRSRTSGTQQHCSNQQDEFMNFQPTTLIFDLKADLHQALGTLPYYVSRAKAAVVGFTVTITKITTAGSEVEVIESPLNNPPMCAESVSTTSPTELLHCSHEIAFSHQLTDGDKLCVDVAAQAGGYYNIQDDQGRSQGTANFPTITATRRVCFTYDGSRPVHCSAGGAGGCSSAPLQLSTQHTRSRELHVAVAGWLDPAPPGGDSALSSGVVEYMLEVHQVHVGSTMLTVEDEAASRTTLNGTAPFNVPLTLPPSEQPQMYAVLLEVHDTAGNVAYARRFVFYDNSSRLLAYEDKALTVVSAGETGWQTRLEDVCVSWKGRYYNEAFLHFNFLLPVKRDEARGIEGVYEENSDLLSASGTASVRGVVSFEVSWQVDNGAQSEWQTVQNVTAESVCLPLSPRDGQTYELHVRATDVTGQQLQDSVTVTVDSTGPELRDRGLRGRWGRDGLHVHNFTDLSLMKLVLEVSDPHSGMTALSWALGTMSGADDLGSRSLHVQRVSEGGDCNPQDHCYCPDIGICERYVYEVSFHQLTLTSTHMGLHHRRYHITITARNMAGLQTNLQTEVLVDVSAPTGGVVKEGAREGRDPEMEVDFTNQHVLHVRWQGFSDPESGVLLYRVALAPRCRTAEEMDEGLNTTEVEGGARATTLTFPRPGHYYTTIVAYNGALVPSPVACSDGVVYDVTPPTILNFTLAHAHTSRALACTSQPQNTWLLGSRLTRTLLTNTTACQDVCRTNGHAGLDVQHWPIHSPYPLSEKESDELCRSLPMMSEDAWIGLPSDRLFLLWDSVDEESQIEDYYVGVGSSRSEAQSTSPDLLPLRSARRRKEFRVNHPGLGQGSVFFLSLQAVNKAGLVGHVVVGPVLMDSTPPRAPDRLAAILQDRHWLMVTWSRADFVDPEQPGGLDFEVTYRIGHEDGFVTPFRMTSANDLEGCAQDDHDIGGCIRVSVSSLRPYDTPLSPRAFFFQLHVTNVAGLMTSINTSSVLLPQELHELLVLDVLPSTADTQQTETEREVAVVLDPVSLCAAWALPGDSPVLQVQFGIGLSADNDDVIAFTDLSDISAGQACVNVTSVPFYKKLYSLVRVVGADGKRTFHSDGFVVVTATDSQNLIDVSVGGGCRPGDVVWTNLLTPDNAGQNVSLSPVSSSLHVGELLFFAFRPPLPQVSFHDAVVLRSSSFGYQVMVQGQTPGFSVPDSISGITTAEVSVCDKDQVFWPRDKPLATAWEVSGPALQFALELKVQVVDATCVHLSSPQQNSSLQGVPSICVVAETRTEPERGGTVFEDPGLFPDRQYTVSVALCFDRCMSPFFTPQFSVDPGTPMADVQRAEIRTQGQGTTDVDVTASLEVADDRHPCYYLWSVARQSDGSRLVSPWSLKEANPCTDLKIQEEVSHEITSGHGTLYICLQPLWPYTTHTTTCTKLHRSSPTSHNPKPFHIIEMSSTTLRTLLPDDYRHTQGVEDKLHRLYDLDLDYADSNLVPAALVTNGQGHRVTWFLMTDPHVPGDEDRCVGDQDCVSERSLSPEEDPIIGDRVVFPNNGDMLENGVRYYVCARLSADAASNMLVPEELCGDGFLVDDDPPAPGDVAIQNAEDGYLAEREVAVTWSGFHDASSPYDVTVLSYRVALGSYPGGEDIAANVSMGNRSRWTFRHLHVVPGTDLYATVTAEDRPGRTTQVSSRPVLFDDTAPSQGEVVVEGVTQGGALSSTQLHVHWRGVADSESGLARQEVSVATWGGHSVRVVSFMHVQGSVTQLNMSSLLLDGLSYVVVIKATNKAGLASITTSEPFIADSSPPIAGWVGNHFMNHLEEGSNVTGPRVYSTSWSGFHDDHSGVAYYRVGLLAEARQEEVVPLHFVGLRTSVTWRIMLDEGEAYVAVVEACNHASLCSTSLSSTFRPDHTPPAAGRVTVGLGDVHQSSWPHSSMLEAHWVGFHDPQSTLREFRWCVGSSRGVCDVTTMSTSLLERRVTATGLTLPVATPLYVTVVAENGAGLKTQAESDSFMVDTTPPVVVTAPAFRDPHSDDVISQQTERSLLVVTWTFADPDAAALTHTLHVAGPEAGRHAREDVEVGREQRAVLTLPRDGQLVDGDVYTAFVTACNPAGLCTTASSQPLRVDSTPPVPGSFLSPLTWEKEDGESGANGTRGNPVTRVTLTWQGFQDEESGVVGYYLTAGRTYSGSELSSGSRHVPHNNASSQQELVLTFDKQLLAGEVVVLSVSAENGVGLLSPAQRFTYEVFLSSSQDEGTLLLQRHSCSPYYCSKECTCAPAGQTCQSNQTTPCVELMSSDSSPLPDMAPNLGCAACRKTDFFTSASCLQGYWSAPADSYNVLRVQWSFGLAGEDPGMGVMDPPLQPAWHEAGPWARATFCLPPPRLLSSGSPYVMHVRAWLSHDSYVTQTSTPVKVDHSAPARRRGRRVLETTADCTRDVDIVRDEVTVTACWSDVFYDPHSGISSYDVWAGTSPFDDSLYSESNVGLDTTVSLNTATMAEGVTYYVTVRAWNGAGLSSTLTSNGVMRDVTPPAEGVVFATSRHASCHATDDVTALSAAWHGFDDGQSGVTAYSAALYDVSNVATPVVDFVDLDYQARHRFQELSLQHRHRYAVAVKARDAAGLESSVVMSPALVVDVTPPEGITCSTYRLEAEADLSMSLTLTSLRYRTYNASMQVDLTPESQLVNVTLSATALRPGARAAVSMNSFTMPVVFMYHEEDRARSHHVLLSESGGNTRVDVWVEGNAGASITAQVFSCVALTTSPASAVKVQQVSPSTVCLSLTVMDNESSLMSLSLGLGTTPGGLQVAPLTHVAQSGQMVMEVEVDHGTQLYALALARNHAGAWSRFVSAPVTFDGTAPVVSGLQLNLRYQDGVGVADTVVTAVAEWMAVDGESGEVSCTCSLGGYNVTQGTVQRSRTDSGQGQRMDGKLRHKCQWQLQQPHHGQRLQAAVRCRNPVQLVASATSAYAVVELKAPDVSQGSIQALNNFGQFCPYTRTEPWLRSGQRDLLFQWAGVDDPAVDHYEYRFLYESRPLSDWSPLPAQNPSAILRAGEGRAGNVTMEVRALNSRNMASGVGSFVVVLDDGAPSLTGRRATSRITEKQLDLDWTGVFSARHYVTFTVFAGTSSDFGDVINHIVTTETRHSAPCDVSLSQVYVIIEAFYTSGASEVYRDRLDL